MGAEFLVHQKILVLCAAAAVLAVFVTVTVKMYLKNTYCPYRAKPILTKREYAFYLMLRREAARRGLLVCPKVGLKDLLEVTSRRHYMRYFAKISQKHVDFVICDRNLRVVFALELDDSSHDSRNARKKDLFKDRAFKAAKVPLKRIRNYDENSVRELFRGID